MHIATSHEYYQQMQHITVSNPSQYMSRLYLTAYIQPLIFDLLYMYFTA